MQFATLIISCEHGGNRIPPAYRGYLSGAEKVLATHQGFDLGALQLARRLARQAQVPCLAHTYTRLLIDTNRSADHPKLFSQYTKHAPASVRQRLAARYYVPHRQRVLQAVADGEKPLLHLAIHSFVPIFFGRRRDVDVGILFDPSRTAEKTFALACKRVWRRQNHAWTLRFNQPYRGVSDGLTTSLRRQFAPRAYAGIEIEINQRHLKTRAWEPFLTAVQAMLVAVTPTKG